jgi:UDP-N-acetyl-alpha-D-muramoyl-L-alanyl-L-glutamate epimerase
MRFRREEIESFHATDYDIDPRTGIVLLRYAFSGAADPISFEERIDLGGPLHLDQAQQACFEHLVRLLHAVAGTSYFKAAAPGVVAIDSGPLTQPERDFVNDVYDKGLREFAYKNGLGIPVEVEIQAEVAQARAPESGGPSHGLAVPIGGGKDSIVVIEALRDMEPTLVAVNPAPAAHRVAQAAGLELVSIKRRIDPAIVDLNRAGALNGHVPITALISLITVAGGYAHGYSTTVMALEGSADEATRLHGSAEINHQWSKSSDCEHELALVLEGVAPGIGYGSALRELSELEISGCFAGLRKYHTVFRSCNRAFSLSGASDGWCNDCPKCRFVYLMLATALGREEMVTVFGSDLLGDPGQIDGFRDLFDVDRKPFECVGTREESIEALSELAASSSWAGSVVVQALAPVAGSRTTARRSPQQVLQTVLAATERITAQASAGPALSVRPASRIRSA